MGENDPILLKPEIPDKWKYITRILAYPYEYFNSLIVSMIIKNLLIIQRKKTSSVN